MKNKIIVGNMKSYMNFKEIEKYIYEIKKFNDQNIILCPSNIYILSFLDKNLNIGLQNIFNEGICTGEITPSQAASLNIKYSIIGHIERKKYFNESYDFINNKIKDTIKSNIIPILCIGEEKKEKNNLKNVIKLQLEQSLKGIDSKDVIIAYEPVWAIGKDDIAPLEQIKENILYIKKLYPHFKVLYGGSINIKNIDKLKNLDFLDGFLIGKESTNIENFVKIIETIRQN